MMWAPSLSTDIPSPGTLGKLFGFKCADNGCYQTPSSRGRGFCLRDGVKPENEDCKPSSGQATEPSEPGACSEPAAETTGECAEPSGQHPEPSTAVPAAGSAAPVLGEDIKSDDAILPSSERLSSAAEIEPASEPPEPGEPQAHTDEGEPLEAVELQSEGEQSRQPSQPLASPSSVPASGEDTTSHGIVPQEEPVLSEHEVEPSEPSEAAAEPEEQQGAEQEQSRQPSVPLASPAASVAEYGTGLWTSLNLWRRGWQVERWGFIYRRRPAVGAVGAYGGGGRAGKSDRRRTFSGRDPPRAAQRRRRAITADPASSSQPCGSAGVRQAAELYAPDGVFCGTEIFAPDDPLWGSASEVVRNTPEQIYAYYDHFARLPELRVVEYAHSSVRVRGEFATQAGTHTFAWQGAEGETTVEMRMRFGFTFRKDDDDHHHPGRPSRWSIVEHYSFALPTAAAVAAAAAAAAGASAPAEEPVVEPTEPAAEPAAEPAEEPEPPAEEPEPPVEPEPPTEPAEEPAAASAPEESNRDGAVVDAAALQATADLLAEERTMLAQQIRELQQRAESAESLAAERAVLRATERVSRAKIDAQLLERAKNAEIIAAQRAEQIAELQRSVANEKSLAAERAQHNVELEQFAQNAKSLASQLATEMVELDRQVDNEIYI
ncbi:similar to Uncharacterized protein conserved in bacteria with a cystatin-like fold [Ectocarpus siliculosus]|uniref:Similar to Uncharacterized protein conserved in bacteria with a cystatin-like fold n=1 Tax=Ectocarpus siliculosus TaxID=2880 RepID=D7FYB2_ECTSI|nr:similar to Uncharacterized protein conserved in bacteria with a cystatin-like fold [Ectocarpus siliculosus]|eukprot:CBJ26551.1 similar to Uncharacterized protein conserved in bacteria with a cystatin-like fold [Ectocarpus siliculosus]